MIFKLLIVIFIGFQLGKERKKKKGYGGRRTFSLVCLASCLLGILSLLLREQGYNFDFTRLMAYGVAGMGFLGTGVIHRTKNKIEGLTTAAAMWCLVPVGFFIGLGYYGIGIISAICIYILLDFKYWR